MGLINGDFQNLKVVVRSTQETGIMNAFEEYPSQEYWYSFEEYHIGHSRLVIRATETGNQTGIQRAIFLNVEYISGSVRWKGKGINLGDTQEMMSLFRNMTRFSKIPDEVLLELYYIYKLINSESGEHTTIIATSFELMDNTE